MGGKKGQQDSVVGVGSNLRGSDTEQFILNKFKHSAIWKKIPGDK